MKKSIVQYVVGAVIIVAFVAYLIFNNKNSSVVTTTTSPTSISSSEPVSSTSSTGTTGSTSTTAGATGSAQYKDGTYTGPVTSAFYGNIQVAAVIQNGKLTNVQLLQYPQEPGHTSEVSAWALPVLQQEAIAAQSAQVNVVSGATQDSQAFQQSLAAALTQAQ